VLSDGIRATVNGTGLTNVTAQAPGELSICA
jgi:hypothetical protein